MSVFIGYPSFMAYQMMKGKKGNNDGFPSVPGMIARYSALGLTNEEMSKNPVWKDLIDNGHDLQMKNFAWSGMSGVGGYEMNFNLWANNVPSVPDISMSTTTTSVSVSVGNSTYNNNLIYMNINNWDINKNHWLKVTSTYEDGDLAFKFYNNSNTKKIGLPANGYVNILAYPEFKGSYMYISTTSNKQGSFTIEQLPLYPGALVFDGVDDYGTCDNFPILTKEKGYTVVALRSYLAESIGYLVYNGTNAKQSAFAFERSDSLDTWSWGKNSSIRNLLPKLMSYQTSNSYNNNIISTGTAIEGDKLIRIASVGGYSNVAIWELVFLDHDATEEELTKIKDYFVKTYPWLFPDQAWTVTGKTNEDEDRATIANITGNGNDLVLSNFGFIEGSGYNEEGEYAGYLVTDGVDDKITSSAFKMGKDFTVVGEWKFLKEDVIKLAGFIKYDAFMFYNYSYYNRINIYIYSPQGVAFNNVDTIKAVTSEGQVYFDFNSIKEVKPGDLADKGYVMNIGHNGSNHTKLALKNFAIYPTVLSKDDCIKAYNYLQTLKAK